mgnify:CR=1 FL=1
MAKKRASKAKSRGSGPGFAKTLGCLTILTSVAVLFAGGIDEGVRTSKIVYTCMAVSAALGFAFWAVIQAVSSYEEIDGG